MVDNLPVPVVFWGSLVCSFLALVVLAVAFILLLRWLNKRTDEDDDE